MKRWALTTMIVAIAACQTADAATGWRPPGIRAAPQGEYGKLMESMPTARSYWPGSPCAGREHVYLNADDAIRAWHPPATQGMADPAGCTVWLKGGMSYSRFCFLLAHELGHLAGLGHTEDKRSIMYPDEVAAAGPCVAVMDQRREAWYGMVGALPWGGRGWRITRKSGTRMVATSRRGCPRALRFWWGRGRWEWSVMRRAGCGPASGFGGTTSAP